MSPVACALVPRRLRAKQADVRRYMSSAAPVPYALRSSGDESEDPHVGAVDTEDIGKRLLAEPFSFAQARRLRP